MWRSVRCAPFSFGLLPLTLSLLLQIFEYKAVFIRLPDELISRIDLMLTDENQLRGAL
jgi:hypothetical protein